MRNLKRRKKDTFYKMKRKEKTRCTCVVLLLVLGEEVVRESIKG
jgi:hypothetical protein